MSYKDFITELFDKSKAYHEARGAVWAITLAQFRERMKELGFERPAPMGQVLVVQRVSRKRKEWTPDNLKFHMKTVPPSYAAKTQKHVKDAQGQSDASQVRLLTRQQWVSELRADKAHQHK